MIFTFSAACVIIYKKAKGDIIVKKILTLSVVILILVLSIVSCSLIPEKESETVTKDIKCTQLLSDLDSAFAKAEDQRHVTCESVTSKYGIYANGKYVYAQIGSTICWLLEQDGVYYRLYDDGTSNRKETITATEFEANLDVLEEAIFGNLLYNIEDVLTKCSDFSCTVSTKDETSTYSVSYYYEQADCEAEFVVSDGMIKTVKIQGVVIKFSYSAPKYPTLDDYSKEIAYDGSAVTITFYHTMGTLQSVLDDAIARFNELYPKITVEHKQVGDYDAVRNQIKNELTVGDQPNLAYCYPDHVALYNVANAVVALDELIASTSTVTRADGSTEIMGLTDAQIADFIPGFYNEGRVYGDGKMYTLPFSKSTEVLYYNKTAFDNWAKLYQETGDEKYNIKVPTTWDEMEETCRKIKALIPNSTPLGYDSEDNWFITMCEQYGSDYTSASKPHYLFDNETNWNFVARFASWYAEGLVTTKQLSGGYTSDAFKKGEGELGKSYMSIGSSAGATHQTPNMVNGAYPFETGIAPIPQVDLNNPKVISQGPSLCILNNENVQEVYASWLFVKFITTDVQTQAEFSMVSGYVPVIQSVNNDEYYQEFLSKANGYRDGISATSAKVCLEQADAYFASPAFNGSSKARVEVGLLMQSCFINYKKGADNLAMIKEKFDLAIEECEY